VNDKFVGSRIEGRGRLETGDIGSVRQLRHCEASNDTIEAEHTFVNPITYKVRPMLMGLVIVSANALSWLGVAPLRRAPRKRP
jgi:hypothetical protein